MNEGCTQHNIILFLVSGVTSKSLAMCNASPRYPVVNPVLPTHAVGYPLLDVLHWMLACLKILQARFGRRTKMMTSGELLTGKSAIELKACPVILAGKNPFEAEASLVITSEQACVLVLVQAMASACLGDFFQHVA